MADKPITIYPNYFGALLQMAILTMLVSIVQIYFWGDWNYWFMAGVFLAVFLLLNKKWIRKFHIDKEHQRIVIEYPLTIFAPKRKIIELNSISKAEYFPYMYRSPSHLNIKSGNNKFRINCSRESANKISEWLAIYDIPTRYPEENKDKYRKMPKY